VPSPFRQSYFSNPPWEVDGSCEYFLTKKPTHPYRSLRSHEVVKHGDIVEDLRTGKQERVASGWYSFLAGQKASEARELPWVNDVVRHNLA
jgi:hypothetical protein